VGLLVGYIEVGFFVVGKLVGYFVEGNFVGKLVGYFVGDSVGFPFTPDNFKKTNR
jgi:hypothetical protein